VDKPNILITSPMSADYVAKLNADPRVGKAYQLPREAWPLFRDMYAGGAEAAADGPKEMGPYFADADVIICMGLPYGSVNWSPRLKWVQAWSAGVDHMRGSGVIEAGLTVTNLAGINSIPVAEHAMTLMLMLTRDIKGFMENARKKKWRPTPTPDELFGKTVGIVGLGGIGRQVAKMCRGFDMHVLAIRRSTVSRETGVQGVGELLPPSDLPYLLEHSDYLVLCCPLTPETEGLIGEGELRAMKPSAFLINVSRGEVVNEPVLKQALAENWIAGAGLDVFWNEPLEEESEFWDMPNVVMTSHRAGRSVRQEERSTSVFEDNLDRYLADQPLMNVAESYDEA